MSDELLSRRKQDLLSRTEVERDRIVKRYDAQLQNVQRRRDAELEAVDRRSKAETERMVKTVEMAEKSRARLN